MGVVRNRPANSDCRGLWLVHVYYDLKGVTSRRWTTPFTETERGEGAATQKWAPGKRGTEEGLCHGFQGACAEKTL